MKKKNIIFVYIVAALTIVFIALMILSFFIWAIESGERNAGRRVETIKNK